MIKNDNINVISSDAETIYLDSIFDNQHDVRLKTRSLFTIPNTGFDGIWGVGETIELEVNDDGNLLDIDTDQRS